MSSLPPTHYLDLALESAALDYVDMQARIADLEADLRAYRQISYSALDALAKLTAAHDRLTERLYIVNAEYRALRERTIRESGVAA